MSDNMRDFFGDLGKRIGETAETMTSKAGDAIEIQRHHYMYIILLLHFHKLF